MFRCRGEDAWVAIAVASDDEFAALCDVIGRPELAADPRFATPTTRHANRSALTAPITAWTSQHAHIEAQDELQRHGVRAGAALNPLELLSNPHVVARHGLEYVDTPNVGLTPYPRMAFTLSETPVPVSGPALGFGEANDYVLGELLGLSVETITDLDARGIATRVPRKSH